MVIELDPVDRITTDAVGPPGERVFYIQARRGDRVVTVLVEKEQVQLLAASVVEILSRVGKETGEGPPEESMLLEEPILPEWRAGRLSIGYQEERDLIVLEVEELRPEDDEGDEGDEGEDDEEEEGGTEAPDAGGLTLGPPFEIRTFGEPPSEAFVAGPAGEARGEVEDEEGEPVGAPFTDDLDEDAPDRVRFWATREQMLSFARHGVAVCASGRPRCPLCGRPMSPEGHICPALNGHGTPGDR